MYCKNCGKEIMEEALFCPKCGQKLNDGLLKSSQQLNNIISSVKTVANDKVKPATSNAVGTVKNIFKDKAKVKKISIAVIAVLIVVVSAGLLISNIGKSDTIVGTWENSDGEVCFVLEKDGSCRVTSNQKVVGKAAVSYKIAESGTITFYDQFYYPYEPLNYEIQKGKLYITTGSEEYGFDEEYEFVRSKK